MYEYASAGLNAGQVHGANNDNPQNPRGETCPTSADTVVVVQQKENPMQEYTTAGPIAGQVPGAKPRDVSDLFYQRLLPDSECLLVSGRRLIPSRLVPMVKRLLQERVKKRELSLEK